MKLQVGTNFVFSQWLAGIGVTMLLLQLGFMGGWPSPTLARLASPESKIPLNPEQISWVASLVNIGRFLGAVTGAVSTNLLGGKQSIFITLFPIAISWLVIALANSVEWLYVARILGGVGLGMSFSSFPIYIGEVSMPEIRGALVSLASCGVPIGQVIASISGSYISITAASSMYFVLCLFLMVMFFWLPESPHHLVKVGKREAAKKSIEWYRAGKGVDKELEAVEKFIASDNTKNFMDKLREFRSPAIRKATFQVIALFTFMQICGLNSIVFYMEIILKRANFTLMSPSLLVILVNVCGICAAALSIVLIDRCGRRFLLLLSSIGITISMIFLMSQFLLIDLDMNTPDMQWLSLIAMFLFVISFFLGLMPVPTTILSETFPANIKCIAACISSLTAAIMSFISAKTYQPMVDLMGETYVFLIYALCSTFVIPYTIFLMPETKGKSLQQIQDELIKK